MKTSFSIYTCFLPLFMLCSLSVSAQGADERAKEKAKDKTNSRIDTRVDEGIDKGLNAIEGLFKKKDKKSKSESETESTTTTEDKSQGTQASSGSEPGAGLFGAMFEPAEWDDDYDFDLRSKAEITTTSKKGKVEKNTMEYYFGDEAMALILEDPKSQETEGMVIFDFANSSFVTLTEDGGQKQGMAIRMNPDQIAMAIEESAEDETVSNGNFRKTGQSKTILGYTCYEYEFSDEDMEGSMWMTEDVELDSQSIFGLATSGAKRKSALPANYPRGYVMEVTSTSKRKQDQMQYRVVELDQTANLNIDLRPYQVVDIAGMANPGK